MNCKPGDLAYVVNHANKYLNGRFVNVVRPYVDGEIISGIKTKGGRGEFVWVVTSATKNPLPWSNDDFTKTSWVMERIIYDSNLRPIRPSDEQDEMLRIVGLPNKEKEKA